MIWVLGEKRDVSAVVSVAIGADPVISSATYEVFDTSDESIVASGSASVSNLIVYFLWQPSDVGNYVARIYYNILDEKYTSSQVIEVRETL